jgi:phosphodiester glycosidase
MQVRARSCPVRWSAVALLVAGAAFLAGRPSAAAEPVWRKLLAGVEYAVLQMPGPVAYGDGLLHVVRVDPAVAELRWVQNAPDDETGRSAGRWCRDRGLAVAINAGMYQKDFRTHVGYLRSDGVLNNGRWFSKYNSILVFGPSVPGLPRAAILDRDAPAAADLAGYGTVIQNLRLIRGNGVNACSQTQRRWSEAAIAQDRAGRLLFLHCRTPYTLYEFSRAVLEQPLDVVRAMHVEGGPEASLSIHAGGVDVDLAGSYETGFNENDDNLRQWSLPFVLGVADPDAGKGSSHDPPQGLR